MLNARDIEPDTVVALRDICPKCWIDLSARLRQHLAECTWIRVQARETRQRAQEARETSKESRQLRNRADVLAREAEAVQQCSRDVKRGLLPPAMSVLNIVLAVLQLTPDGRYCAPCLAAAAGIGPNHVRRIMELAAADRQGLSLERAECGTCHTVRRTLSVANIPL